ASGDQSFTSSLSGTDSLIASVPLAFIRQVSCFQPLPSSKLPSVTMICLLSGDQAPGAPRSKMRPGELSFCVAQVHTPSLCLAKASVSLSGETRIRYELSDSQIRSHLP